ncbi:MAG: flagellar protein FlaG [Azonexus sp.]|jgi:flagellar protein FlaG|nr:flagellar protein FlaG [Azonexus sp.]
MSIQSITANTQPNLFASSASKAPAQAKDVASADAASAPVTAARSTRTAPETRSDGQPTEQDVQAAVDQIDKFVATSAPNTNIAFSIDPEDGFLVKVIDGATKEVIRQFPSKEAIAIAKALDKLQGLFVRDKI